MTDIAKRRDCGNSPKMQLLQDFAIAVARADAARLLALVTEDVCWRPVGRQPVSGAPGVCKALTRNGPASRVTIDHVVSHGRAGAVDGVVEFGPKRRAFCFVIDFNSATGGAVSSVTSYSVALQ